MSTFVNNDVAAGDVVRASDHNTQGANIAAVLNGGIENANIATNAGISGSKLADASIANAKLKSGAGEPGGAWNSWTPTWTNVTVGNGTVDAKYKQVGKTVFARILFTMGSTSSISGQIIFSLPVTAAIGTNYTAGVVNMEDNTVLGYEGTFRITSTTACSLICYVASSTYATSAGATGTVPFTWGTGDFFRGTFVYEAA